MRNRGSALQAYHPSRARQSIIATIAGVAILAAGFLGGMAANWNSPPPLLAAPSSDMSIAIATRQFDDAQLVGLQLQSGPDRFLQSPGGGRLTSFQCSVGMALYSGESVLSIDGTETVSLATSHPLWRDIPPGTHGTDVTDVSHELVRLGYLAQTTSTADAAFAVAWKKLAKASGVPVATDGTVALGSVVWLPADGITVSSCDTAVGDQVVGGKHLAQLAPTITGALLIVQPAVEAAGTHVLLIGAESFTLSADGAITEQTDLARLADLADVQQALQPGGTMQVTGTYKLAQPVLVSVVPPASVVVQPDGTACVVGDGTPRPVRIVGSQLGQTYVTFDGPSPQRVSLDPGSACG